MVNVGRDLYFFSKLFDYIVGFTQVDFYPHISAPFLQKLALKVFVEKYDLENVIGRLLVEEQNLGRNTDITLMTAEKGSPFSTSLAIIRVQPRMTMGRY
jgi:hypothetical protein